MTNREELIEIITRRVLAELERDPDEQCADCGGACASHCPDKVRSLVDEGAARIAYHGRGGDIPSDIDFTKEIYSRTLYIFEKRAVGSPH